MKRKLQNVLATATVLTAFLSMGTIAHAASTSSSYEFTLNHCIVDGKQNSTYHYLESGDVYISGSHYEYATGINPVGPNTIHYALLRDKLGPDVNCGSISCSYDVNPSGKLGTADKTSSKYYLQIYKIVDDGRDVKGSGTIYNE